MKLRNIPNIITTLRLILIAPFAYYLLHAQYTPAFYLFIAAGISDGVDGFLARTFHWQSKFGAFADPLADKLLVTASYLLLGYLGIIPLWFMILVVLRDIVIASGATTWYVKFGSIEFNPTLLSKINTTLQIVLVLIVLGNAAYHVIPALLLITIMAITTLTTSWSFIDYVWVWSRKAYIKSSQMQQ